MEKESITELMLGPDSFYGAVSEALDRFEEPNPQDVEFLAVASSADFAMKHYKTLAEGRPLIEGLSELCRANGLIPQPEVSGCPQLSALDVIMSPEGDLCACIDCRTVTILAAGETRPIVTMRADPLDGVVERPVGQNACIPSVRRFGGPSCPVDGALFKTGEDGIAPAGWRDIRRRKKSGRSSLYYGEEEHRRLFADVPTGGCMAHKAGSLLTATGSPRKPVDESDGSGTQ
ncbi:MAG: hypothetical protein IKQ60_10800 [Candidatus Methanomethylophilaceae archaeon]|nr:hypothetical protein [Candidatus Methanomethylophilaceae archaeon]